MAGMVGSVQIGEREKRETEVETTRRKYPLREKLGRSGPYTQHNCFFHGHGYMLIKTSNPNFNGWRKPTGRHLRRGWRLWPTDRSTLKKVV